MKRVRLIPRYNWDYGFGEWLKSTLAVFSKASEPNGITSQVFGHEAVFISSGRAALYTILKALNIPQGSGVGVPLFCCPVVFDAIRQAGLVPIFIDIDPNDYNLLPSDLERKRARLSAVVVVHMFGHPADMDAISNICNGIPVIEDCAQSLFSQYKERYTGLMGDASFFSFRSGKYISAGEGSAILSKSPELLKTIKRIAKAYHQLSHLHEILHCTSTLVKSIFYKRPWYGVIGQPVGTRLDRKFNLTAKEGFSLGQIARTDLEIVHTRLENFLNNINRQRENSLYLLRRIRPEGLILPKERHGCWSNYYQFPIRFTDQAKRDHVADRLLERGIDTAKYLDEVIEVATAVYNYQGDCPNSELCSKTTLIIPNHYTLSIKDLDHIINSINQVVGNLAWARGGYQACAGKQES